MILASILLLGVVTAYAAFAGYLALRLGLGFRQALFYAPFKIAYRISDRPVRIARKAETPVVYAIVHQSRLDPALMLSLLPEDTLHILDPESARSGWLEPWRALARNIPFNAEHVFVSRRLVRHLRGKGRLAVYIPDAIEPDAKTFRLYRAVARIAVKADAKIVPLFIGGARQLPFSYAPVEDVRGRWLPKLSIGVMEPATIAELSARTVGQDRPSNTLFDRLAEARIAAGGTSKTLFQALREAADRHGPNSVAVEDVLSGSLTYRRLLIAARALGSRFRSVTAPGDTVGIMLPNANALAVSLAGLFSASRAAAMINFTAGPAAVTAAVRTAMVRTVVTSRAFVAKAELADIVDAAARGGAKVLYLEDLQRTITVADQAAAALLWRKPLARQAAARPAVVLFTSGSEGSPKAVVLSHGNILANTRQIEARLAFSPRDKLLNVLPAFHCFGLTGGTLLPLLTGVRLFLYPSPLHYKLVPETAARVRPTIMVGTDTFLAGYARNASDGDFSSLRLVVAGAEPVRQETRRIWRERFGAEIVEGFGLTEAAPVVAVNSATHGREGTVGRLLPGMRSRIEPVEGIADGGRLWIAGPNLMLGYMNADRPGELQPLDGGWHDTGDIVSIDRDGYITIRGRARRFAKIGGEMVSLGAVETLAQQLWPEQRHAAVAVPDKRRGEGIVLVTTASDADAGLLRQFAKKSGASALSVPQDVVTVGGIPLLGTGKTDYAAARRLALHHLGLQAAA
jgi:acyl-[acyl-carrier-protein]-phospholipid O-acyltransferase/long-chain-fatty-acid--[acyl-carrier-protein] ligase